MKTFIFTTNNPKSREEVRNTLDYLNDLNKAKQMNYVFTIKKHKPIRSTSQNSYYWIILQAIASVSGDTDDDLHEWYKLEFNSKEVQGRKIGHTTTDLDSLEFTVYLNKVKEHGKTFHGAHIVDPKDRFYDVWEQQTKERYNAMFASI